MTEPQRTGKITKNCGQAHEPRVGHWSLSVHKSKTRWRGRREGTREGEREGERNGGSEGQGELGRREREIGRERE